MADRGKDEPDGRTGGSRAAGRVTLRDVAKVAGVSHQTVSRAINGKGEIDPQTQQRVLEVAKELRYRPSRFGRGLARPDVTSVGVIVPDVVNPFFPEFIAGVLRAADSRDWRVVVTSVENDFSREPELVRSLGQQVDAIIGYLSYTDEELDPYVGGVPLVIVDRGLDSSTYGLVEVDTATGIRAGLQHLVDRGHRRIAMIDWDSPCDPVLRRNLFHELAAEFELPVDDGWIVTDDQSIAGGDAAFLRLRDAHPDLTAVLATNDLVAIGALQAAQRLGLRVPEDCAFVGFDGLSIGELVTPALTTVHLDKRRLGELAIGQVDRLLGDELPPPVVLTPHLIIRSTT